jgi:hypothetical protein
MAAKKKKIKLSTTEQKIRELQAEASKLKQAEDKKKTDKVLAKLDDRAKIVWDLIKDELGYLDDSYLKLLMKGTGKNVKLNLTHNTHKPYFVCQFFNSPIGNFLSENEAIDCVNGIIHCGTRYLVIDVDNQRQVEVKIRIEFQ